MSLFSKKNMNKSGKVINTTSSSLIDLKAELIRKQEEFRKEKLSGGAKSALLAAKRATHKKVSLFSKKNAGVAERAQQDLEEKQEEEETSDNRKAILEAKAKLYENMTKGNILTEEDGSGRFLVDFQKKNIDNMFEKKEKERKMEEEKERHQIIEMDEEINRKIQAQTTKTAVKVDDHTKESTDPSEDWVDYVDSFGRSRRCLAKDLPDFLKRDKKSAVNNKNSNDQDSQMKDLMSEDMYREVLRQQWEKEQEEMLENQETVYYSNLRFNEKRTHGTAYYEFAKDEDTRKEQMEMLSELRKQTLNARERKGKLKAKRKAVLEARLAKVKERKMIAGNNIEEKDDSSNDEEDGEITGLTLNEETEKPKLELLKRDESLRKTGEVREWDKGKKDLSSWLQDRRAEPEKSYLEKRRDERIDDFAPPQMYYDSGSKVSSIQKPGYKLQAMWNSKTVQAEQFDKIINMDTPQTEHHSGPSTTISNVSNTVDSNLSAIRAKVSQNQQSTCHVSNIPLPVESKGTVNFVQNEGAAFNETWNKTPEQFHPVPYSTQSNPYHTDAGYQYSNTCIPYQGYYTNQESASNAAIHVAYSQQELYSVEHQAVNIPESTFTPQNQPLQVEPVLKSTSVTNTSTTVISAAPMIYERIGSHVSAPPKQRYERVNLHELPSTLPVPPSASNMPEYPSQEDVFKQKTKKLEKSWHNQYKYDRSASNPTSKSIPFVSPYVQNKDKSGEDLYPTSDFDPSKPPPQVN